MGQMADPSEQEYRKKWGVCLCVVCVLGVWCVVWVTDPKRRSPVVHQFKLLSRLSADGEGGSRQEGNGGAIDLATRTGDEQR